MEQAEPLNINVNQTAISNGIYDPSIAQDDKGKLWMSYSAVVPSKEYGIVFSKVSTRLAYSNDKGLSWHDIGQINSSEKVKLPFPHGWLDAAWEHEVAAIEYNPYANKEHRWIMLWHRYLRIYDKKGPHSQPLFEHGWISLKSASDPEGRWSSERKLFAGMMYDDTNDNTIGKPEMRLDKLFSGNKKMGGCAAFTEPGLLATSSGVYVSVKCATGNSKARVALLKCSHDFKSCDYKGVLLKDEQAKLYGKGFSGFSATELFQKNGSTFLMVTPIKQPGETYHGCLVFKVQSLEQAQLVEKNGKPEKVLYVSGSPGSINGACGYHENTKSGIIFGQYFPEKPNFRLFNSKKIIP